MAKRPAPPRRLRFQDDDFNAPPASDDMLGEVVWAERTRAQQRYHRRMKWAWRFAAVVAVAGAVVAAVAVTWAWIIIPPVAVLVVIAAVFVLDRWRRP